MAKRQGTKGGGEIVVVNTGNRGVRHYTRQAMEFHQKTGAGYIIAAGLVTLAVTSKSATDIEWVKKNWWGLAIGVLILGWLLWRRHYKYASALLAVGAVLLVQAWRAEKAKEAANKTNPDGTKTTAGIGGFKWMKTPNGEWVGYPTSGNEETSGPSLEWVQTPTGQWVGVPALPARRSVEGPSADELAEQITRQTYANAA